MSLDQYLADSDCIRSVWHYRELADAFCRLRPGQLANELSQIVDVLEKEPASEPN